MAAAASTLRAHLPWCIACHPTHAGTGAAPPASLMLAPFRQPNHACAPGALASQKPGNVLLRGCRTDRRGFVAMVADFGLSKVGWAAACSVHPFSLRSSR